MRVGKGGGISVQAERKLFSFNLRENGCKVEIVEVSNSKSLKVVLSMGVVAWLIDCLGILIQRVNLGSFFRRWRAVDSWWI